MPPKKEGKNGSPSKGSKSSPKSQKSNSKKLNDNQHRKVWPDNDEEDSDETEVVIHAPKGVMAHRLKFVLQSEIESDVEFIVGPDDHYVTIIKANKCILLCRSEIFSKIFLRCDEWKNVYTGDRTDLKNNFINETDPIVLKDLQISNKKSPDISASGSPKQNKKSPDKSQSKSKSPKENSKGKSPDKKDKKSKSKSGSPKKGHSENKKGTSKKDIPETVDEGFLEDEIYGWDKIRVKDVKADGMYSLLRYIYYDEMEFHGVIGAINTLTAARKYQLPDLKRACITYLENNICVEHVLKLLQLAYDINEDRMKFLCIQLLANETYEILGRQEFVDISHQILDIILSQEVLNIREVELFQRVQHWAAHQCRLNNLLSTPLNERMMVGKQSLEMIRFPAFLPHEFATIGINSGYLRQDEIITILSYYVTCRQPKIPYSIYPRKRPCLDLPMETDSVAFSDQTDLTFQGYKIRRCHSFKDLTIPMGVLGPIKQVGLLPKLTRQDSLPADLNVSDDNRSRVIDNMFLLKDLDHENRYYEFAKDNLVLLRKHYR